MESMHHGIAHGATSRRAALGMIASLAALSLCGNALAQSAPGDLLPEEVSNRLRVSLRQAGRDVEIWVVNPKGPWVVTSITFGFEYKPALPEGAHAPETGEPSGFYPNPAVRTWPVHLLPEKGEELRMRLADASVLAGLRLLEVRGRERTIFETVQRYLFQEK
jgi:hypothetical protein